MMRELQALWPREDGVAWLLTKLHEQFHVPVDIHRHGRHANVHSGPQEHNHIVTKKASKKTQMQRLKIDLQTGERIVDRLILQRAFDRVHETVWHMDRDLATVADDDPEEGWSSLVKNATKGVVIMEQAQTQDTNGKRQKHDIMAGLQWRSTKNNTLAAKILHEEEVVAFIMECFFDEDSHIAVDENGELQRQLDIQCFTEYQRNGFVYRCHPLYRGEYAYYDWCYVNWEVGDEESDEVLSLIGRINLFIETPQGEIKAIVQSFDETTSEDHGVFGTYWYLEQHGSPDRPLTQRPKFHLVDVDSLGDYAMVVPYENDQKRFIHIHDRSKWPGYFQTIP
jgi:hypothetical protein